MKLATVLSAVALFGASALAGPVAEAEDTSLANNEPAALYHVHCTGGMHADSRCTNGEKKDGCRCDSKGTYLCDPSSLAKSGGPCAKCGCKK